MQTRMSYLLTLNALNSERLEELAKRERVQAPELIERIIVGYLDSTNDNAPPPDQANPTLETQGIAGVRALFQWDEDKGFIVFTPANRRVFVMNAHSWDAVEQDLFTKLLKGAAPLISEIGAAYGRATALDYRSITDDPESLASYFEHLGLTTGWGRFSLAGDLSEGSKLTVRVRGCVFCESRNANAGRTDPCHFIVGVCKGITDTIFGFSHSVQETKCCARGNDFCEILIVKATDSERAAWPPGPNPMTGASWK